MSLNIFSGAGKVVASSLEASAVFPFLAVAGFFSALPPFPFPADGCASGTVEALAARSCGGNNGQRYKNKQLGSQGKLGCREDRISFCSGSLHTDFWYQKFSMYFHLILIVEEAPGMMSTACKPSYFIQKGVSQ